MSKHPMLESSENNECDRFWQQEHPPDLCSVCLNLVTQKYCYKRKKKSPAGTQGLTDFSAGRISEKKSPYPVCMCSCRSGLSTRCTANSAGLTSSPAWLTHSVLPGHSLGTKRLCSPQLFNDSSRELSTQITSETGLF